MSKFAKSIILVGGSIVAISLSFSVAQAADVEAGKTIYLHNCISCHGNKGQGGIGAKLKGDAAYWTADLFARAVLQGLDDEGKKLKKPMPLFGTVGLTDPKGQVPTADQLANVQAYIQTFGPKSAN